MSFRTPGVEAWGEDCVGTDATGPLNADTYDFELLDCLWDFNSAKDMSASLGIADSRWCCLTSVYHPHKRLLTLRRALSGLTTLTLYYYTRSRIFGSDLPTLQHSESGLGVLNTFPSPFCIGKQLKKVSLLRRQSEPMISHCVRQSLLYFAAASLLACQVGNNLGYMVLPPT